ncbi:hypothetical protein B7R21_03800 [Subtercola boreus]|uniref:Uncharacterized protein n=1 Tax=Subtercola boreus TaxID=120213 RepID=A0A3E0W259_9MICO|nr:hypothetical protein [Subtercola boreus]RFA15167.1 hypothetical protein B7R21_03800 [Subtercola boreus]
MLVELVALGVVLTVRFTGCAGHEIDDFVLAWQRCGARRCETRQAGSIVIDAVVWAAGNAGHEAGEPAGTVPPAAERLAAGSFRELSHHLSGLITRSAIGARRGELLMLHAGAVSSRETGGVIAFIGPSGRGKTTASTALGRHFGYVTDETVAIADGLAVIAYPKPLSVKLPEPEPWKSQVAPGELGLIEPGEPPLRLVGLVMLDRRPSGSAAVARVALAEAVEELVPQISFLAERRRALQHLGSVVDACGGLHSVTYSEAVDLPAVFAELFEQASGRAALAEQPVGPHDARARYRSIVDDALPDGSSLIVLQGGTVSVLAGIAPVLVTEAAGTGRFFGELVEAVRAAHGEPPAGDAVEAVANAIDELVGAGLLERSDAL